ncbi:MAG TPA: hypothetical protein VFM64_01280 [Candidatus Nitrosotenuis sp.]|nr:hypothetical protein [Candidatus Nitrosotenuis sp.]
MSLSNVFLFAVFGMLMLLVFSSGADYSTYGMLAPLLPEELLEQSETIFVGNVTSKNTSQVEYSDKVMIDVNGSLKPRIQNYTTDVEEYTVRVEEFLKNPQGYDVMLVREPMAGARFEVGDRVILYVSKLGEKNEYRFESFALPESCDAKDALMQQRLWFAGSEFTIMQDGNKFDGYKKKEFQNLSKNEPIQFVYRHDVETMFGKRFDIQLEIIREDSDGFGLESILNQTVKAEAEPCKWIANTEWEFIPEVDGVYRIVGTINSTSDGESSSNELLFNTRINVGSTNMSDLPPLRQLQNGVLPSEIICTETLQLIFKSSDDSPICVTPETKQILIERGWAKPI